MQTFAFSATVVVSPLKFFATTIVNIPQFAMRYACNDIRIVVLYLCQKSESNNKFRRRRSCKEIDCI